MQPKPRGHLLLLAALSFVISSTALRASDPPDLPAILSASPFNPGTLQKALLDGADPNALVNNSLPLDLAIKAASDPAVAALLAAGADPDAVNGTPLRTAVLNNQPAILLRLLQAGADTELTDDAGNTPLLLAVQSAAPELISPLLNFGANPFHKNKASKTAFDLAATHAELLPLLQSRGFHPAGSPLNILQAAPADDLVKLTTDAPDFSTVQLAPATYTVTQLQLSKSLTLHGDSSGKTIITSPDAQTLIYVHNSGHLWLDRVTLKVGGKTEIGLFIDSGSALVTNCTCDAPPKAAFYTHAGSLVVLNSRVTNAVSSAIGADSGAFLTVRSTNILKCSAGIIANNCALLAAFDNTLVDVDTAIQSSAGDCSSQIHRNVLQPSATVADPKTTDGIDIIGGRNITIDDNRLNSYASSITVSQDVRAPALVRNNFIANPYSGIHISIAAALPRAVATLDHNSIFNPKMAGLFVENAQNIFLKSNVIVAHNFPAVILQEKSHGTLENNTILSNTEAVGIRGTPPDSISYKDDTIAGDRTPDVKTITQTPSVQRFAAAVAYTPEGRKLLAASNALCDAFDHFTFQKPESVKESLDAFGPALLATQKAEDSLAQITFKIKDCAEVSYAPSYDLYQYLGGELGHAQLTGPDFNGTSFFINLLHPKEPVAQFLHDSLPPDLVTVSSNQSPDLPKLIAALNGLLAKASIYTPERFAGITLSSDSQKWLKTDPGKDPASVFRQLNRYLLEDAYPDALFSSRPLKTRRSSDPAAFVPPGDYFAVPVNNPELLTQATVTAGQKNDLVVPAPHTLWVHVAMTSEVPLRLFTLRSDDAMRAAYSKYRVLISGYFEPVNIRPDLAPQQTAAALAAARKFYPQFVFRPDTSKLPPDQSTKVGQAWWMAQRAIFRVFQVLGTSEDVSRLIADGSSTTAPPEWYQTFKLAYLAAAIEARLGTLSQGQLSSHLQTANPTWNAAAAAALHHFGIRSADSVIYNYLSQATTEADVTDAAWVLSDDDSAAALSAMRALTAKYQANKESRTSLPTPVIIHLLVYGNAEDRRHAFELPLDPDYDLVPLFPLTDDPKTALEGLVNDPAIPKFAYIRTNMNTAVRYLDLANGFPSNRFKTVESYISSSFWQWGYAHPGELNSYNEREGGDRAFWNWQYVSSPVNLNDYRADRFYSKAEEPADPAYYGSFEQDSVLKYFSDTFQDFNLDFVPHDLVVNAATPALRSAFGNDAVDAYISAHQVVTTENTFAFYCYDNGLERRAFTLGEPDKASIFCIAALRPVIADNTLRATLSFSMESHFVNGAMLGIGADPIEQLPIYPYLINGHQALIKSVRLIGLDSSVTPVNLQSVGADRALSFTFQGPLPSTGINNRFLDVELQFFNQHTHLLFNLSISTYATQLRSLGTALASAEASTKANASDYNSWINYAQTASAVGQLSLANQAYEHAATLQPGNLDITFAAADMFFSNGLFDQAIAILEEAAKKNPSNTDIPLYLGTYQFMKGDYKSASATFQKLQPKDANDPIILNRVLCAELAGDHATAIAQAQTLTTAKSPARALAFWYIAVKSQSTTPPQDPADVLKAINQFLNSPDADATSRTLLSILTGQSNPGDAINQSTPPVDRCRFNAAAGLNSLFNQKTDDAAAYLTAALATGQQDQPEYRIAAQRLAALKGH